MELSEAQSLYFLFSLCTRSNSAQIPKLLESTSRVLFSLNFLISAWDTCLTTTDVLFPDRHAKATKLLSLPISPSLPVGEHFLLLSLVSSPPCCVLISKQQNCQQGKPKRVRGSPSSKMNFHQMSGNKDPHGTVTYLFASVFSLSRDSDGPDACQRPEKII